MNLITIDPGNKTGVALFRDGSLIDCGLLRCDVKTQMVALIINSVCEKDPPARAVIEMPRIYKRTNWEGDPNDLIKVAKLAGLFVGCISKWCPVQEVFPQDWKGQRPKTVDNKFTWSLLDKSERAVFKAQKVPKSYEDNVLDAIGIGLWKVGRR